MRTRFTRLVAALAVFLFASLPARGQPDTSFKLSTTNTTAAAEFRAGMSDLQNVSFESAAAHFKAATNADPNFGLVMPPLVVRGGFAALSSAASCDSSSGVGFVASLGVPRLGGGGSRCGMIPSSSSA